MRHSLRDVICTKPVDSYNLSLTGPSPEVNVLPDYKWVTILQFYLNADVDRDSLLQHQADASISHQVFQLFIDTDLVTLHWQHQILQAPVIAGGLKYIEIKSLYDTVRLIFRWEK